MSTANQKEPQRQRHSRSVLEKPLFNWNAQGRYVKLINFEMEVTDILEMKRQELTYEEKVPVIKKWLGWKGLQLIQIFIHENKRKMKNSKRAFLDTKQNIQVNTTEL